MDTIDIIEKMVDDIIGEEYGGCHPDRDNPCILKAVVSDGKEGYGARIIYVWVVGKWRSSGRTGWRGLPSNKAITEAIMSIRQCTGSKYDEHGGLIIDGTFGRKEIMLEFMKFNVSADTLKNLNYY